jgi:hypothetical protein
MTRKPSVEQLFYTDRVFHRVEHWFNRRYGVGRRDVYLLRDGSRWRVLGRLGGTDGPEVTHDFDDEDQARAMLQRMLETTPADASDWAKMTAVRPS